MRRRLLLLGALAAPAVGQAQARALKIVVPFPPGGAADITARLLAEQMAPLLGQPVVIENRPGAGGNIAAEAVARSAPDGATVFLGGATIFCANRYLYRNSMPFDALRDFAHISRVSIGTTLLVTRADRPWQDFGQLVAAAKAAPGRLSAGNSGWGTISNLTIAKLCRSAGIEIAQVPYRGLAPGINDLLAGNLDMLFDGLPAIVPHVREGRLRALAVGSARRVTYVPGIEAVPGMAELIPGTDMDMEFWYCLSAPAGTPADVVARLHQASIGAARNPAYADKLLPLGFTAITDDSPAALTDLIRREDAVWKGLVELSGVKLD
ncbi:tripartite tricarboxylate transporter substrate binding protein [Dankookia sp. GCM10030260]|uniref:tripartite tricarboxylate transporter substrate binding protein n=1 Tax=Dankookia sp. GCM10030260 TaxID=3273390 RepID=UPI003608934E